MPFFIQNKVNIIDCRFGMLFDLGGLFFWLCNMDSTIRKYLSAFFSRAYFWMKKHKMSKKN